MPDKFIYHITKFEDIIDGDTVFLRIERRDIDFGFHFFPTLAWEAEFRLTGPENTYLDTPERGKAKFTEATNFTKIWIQQSLNADIFEFKGETFKDNPATHHDEETDNFGRYLIDLYREDSAGVKEHLYDALLRNKLLKGM